jgi:hypothetical protein
MLVAQTDDNLVSRYDCRGVHKTIVSHTYSSSQGRGNTTSAQGNRATGGVSGYLGAGPRRSEQYLCGANKVSIERSVSVS